MNNNTSESWPSSCQGLVQRFNIGIFCMTNHVFQNRSQLAVKRVWVFFADENMKIFQRGHAGKTGFNKWLSLGSSSKTDCWYTLADILIYFSQKCPRYRIDPTQLWVTPPRHFSTRATNSKATWMVVHRYYHFVYFMISGGWRYFRQ